MTLLPATWARLPVLTDGKPKPLKPKADRLQNKIVALKGEIQTLKKLEFRISVGI